jgi:Tfp pilus tip-associated adhesin PilY1
VDNAAAERDQVLYVGGEDGLLHAILAGRHQASGRYAHEAPECGSELWGYLPGSLLPDLNGQPFDDATALTAIHVDGTPRVRELFIDDDGDGQREWRTVLIGTASSEAANRGGVFALDVSDPYRPRLLWEAAFDGLGPGRSRGTALGGADVAPRVYVTAATTGRVDADGVATSGTGSYGAMACALDLADGQRLWQFVAPYSGAAANVAEPPSLPAVMTAAASGGVDGVVFGDLAGRLWLLDAASGAPLGGRPVWVTPGGEREPIGGGIALHNRLALFGTGAVTYADGTDAAAVYAVEILPEGGRLLWSVPLAAGEVLWGAPAFDRFGRAYLGVGTAADDRGRLLVIDPGGGLAAEVPLSGVPGGTPALGNGTVVVVSRSGAVELIGEPYQPPAAELSPAGRVRLFSWRVR